MSKYGEPWHIDKDEHVINSSDKDMGGPETWQRIVACVNALEGCPDPQAFVGAMKRILNMPGLGDHIPLFDAIEFKDAKSLFWLKDKP